MAEIQRDTWHVTSDPPASSRAAKAPTSASRRPARALDSKCKLEQKPGQHGAAGAQERPPVGLRRAAAREAEGQAHLRPARAPVPLLLPEGLGPEGQYRREPAAHARDRAWTTSSTAWASRSPAPRPASSFRTPRSGSTERRSTCPHTRSVPAMRSRCPSARKSQLRVQEALTRLAGDGPRSGLGRSRREEVQRHVQGPAGALRSACRHQRKPDHRALLEVRRLRSRRPSHKYFLGESSGFLEL